MSFWRFLWLGLGRLWLLSLRVRWSGGSGLPSQAVLALWHEHLPACIPIFAYRGIGVLVSQSRDGRWAAETCSRLGYRVFRGSSSRGALGGMKAMARSLVRDGGLAGMALDGPRGPRGNPKPGSLWLAGKARLPLVPVALRFGWHFRLGTWDRTVIPLPFSRVEVRLGAPLFPRDLGEIGTAMRVLVEACSSLKNF